MKKLLTLSIKNWDKYNTQKQPHGWEDMLHKFQGFWQKKLIASNAA